MASRKKNNKTHTAGKGKNTHQMPGLIFNNVTVEEDTDNQKKAINRNDLIDSLRKSPNYSPKAKQWMWVGVIGISAIIFVLWGWAMKVQISFFNWNKTPESALLQKNQNNWDTLFVEAKEERQQSLAEKEVKDIVRHVLSNSILSATSTSSTSTTN